MTALQDMHLCREHPPLLQSIQVVKLVLPPHIYNVSSLIWNNDAWSEHKHLAGLSLHLGDNLQGSQQQWLLGGGLCLAA